MLDILQSIDKEFTRDRDPHGYLAELAPWSVRMAEAMADEEGLELTAEHWKVIHLLREHYRFHGPSKVRDLTEGLEEQFMLQGGMKYLYSLFPRGPLAQASRIAGLPMPAMTSDASFGTVH